MLNCLFSAEDDRISEHIFGADLSTIRGRKLRSESKVIPTIPTHQVIQDLKTINTTIRSVVDVFFVNGEQFSHSISQNIGLCTTEVLPDRHADSALK